MITKNNLKIDRDLSVNTNWKPTCIEAYIENRGIVYVPDDSGETWANIYAMYVPKDKSVRVECNIHTDYSCSEPFTLEITDEERKLIASEIERICMEEEGCACEEFIRNYSDSYCEEIVEKVSAYYDDIARVLTDYEHPEDVSYNVPEAMYDLLVKIQNCIEV